MPDNNFIYTSDKETADKLIELGLKLLSISSNVYTFVNDSTCNFEHISKTFQTNRLTF